MSFSFFFQAEDGIRDGTVTGVQTCALPIWPGMGRLRLSRRVRATGQDHQRCGDAGPGQVHGRQDALPRPRHRTRQRPRRRRDRRTDGARPPALPEGHLRDIRRAARLGAAGKEEVAPPRRGGGGRPDRGPRARRRGARGWERQEAQGAAGRVPGRRQRQRLRRRGSLVGASGRVQDSRPAETSSQRSAEEERNRVMTTGIAPLTARPAWRALQAHHEKTRDLHLRTLFEQDPKRGERLTAEAAGLYLDYSKNRITDETLDLLVQLAEESGLRARIDAMFAGEKINVTENRAVLHVALRAPRGTSIVVDGEHVVPQVHAVLDKMSAFAERVRSGAWKGHTGRRIRNVINIGIGGSDLGPAMAYE